MTILADLAQERPEAFHSAKDIGEATGPAFDAAKKSPDSVRKAVKKALDDLIAEGKVEGVDSGYRLVYRPDGTQRGDLDGLVPLH